MPMFPKNPARAIRATGPALADLARFGVVFAPDFGDGNGYTDDEDFRARLEEEPVDDGRDDDGYESDEDASDAFLKTLRSDEQGDPDADPEAPKTEKADAKPDAKTAPTTDAQDDHVVTVKVGEEEHKVAVKDLKRLFGQEAALTQKSQEVAAARDEARAKVANAQAVVTKALERAEARFKPYAELDFLVLSKTLDAESLKQLRQDAREAYEEVEYLKQDLQGAKQTASEVDTAAARERAVAAVETLKAEFPKQFGTAWSDESYNETWQWAEKQGLKGAGQIADPAAIVMMRKAMLYDRGKTLVAEKVKKVAEQPRKPLRNATTPTSGRGRDGDDAMARLRRTGNDDDATAAFMARLRRDAD